MNLGDPGSPIFEWIGNRWQQVGIATYGIDCSRFQEFGVYTRIIDYIDWIQSITKTSPITTSTPITTTISTTTRSMKPPELYRCNHTLTCGCGAVPVVSSPARIIGGENAVDYSWPMMVSIRWPMEDIHWCGGTILSNSFILTAAHCLYGYESNPPEHLTISVGLTSLVDARQIRHTADRIYIHPNYTGSEEDHRHDIALIRINESLPMGNNLFVTKTCILPLDATIPDEQYIENGTRLTTIGWGKTEVFGAAKSNILQQVEVYAIDHNDSICATALTDPQSEFCAGLYEGGKGLLINQLPLIVISLYSFFLFLDSCQGRFNLKRWKESFLLSINFIFRRFRWTHIPMDRTLLGTSGPCLTWGWMRRTWQTRYIHSVIVLL